MNPKFHHTYGVLYLCQHCLVFIRLKTCVIAEKLDISFLFTGESNLKQRTAVSLDDTGVFVPQSKLKIECETPNAVLNKFNGYMWVKTSSKQT